MKFQVDKGVGRYYILSYTRETITLNTQVLQRSFIISPETLITDWLPQSVSELLPQHFNPVIALTPAVFVLGTGSKQRFLAPPLLAALHAAGIGVEIMDSAAACRCYNVLHSEDRAVVAGIMMPNQ